MSKLNELYKEKTKLELLKQTNIQFIRKLVNDKDSQFDYEWMLKEIVETANAIKEINKDWDEVITKIDKELGKKEF